MLFNSFNFLLFFPVATIVYFLLPHKWRWLHLLVASCIFYCAFIPIYILILFFAIIINYNADIWIENAGGRKRKWFLTISIVANVSVLAVFKYYNFFTESIKDLLEQLNVTINQLPLLNIILPIGLSFHTFQAMSYTIEVYRGKQKAEKHFGIYALCVMFYPHLVAGPIERPQNVLRQFYEHHQFDLDRVAKGLRMMLWGTFMKVVVADRLSLYVKAVYLASLEISESISKQMDVPFINARQDAAFVLHPECFADIEHLNDKGAILYSKFVCNKINELKTIQ